MVVLLLKPSHFNPSRRAIATEFSVSVRIGLESETVCRAGQSPAGKRKVTRVPEPGLEESSMEPP